MKLEKTGVTLENGTWTEQGWVTGREGWQKCGKRFFNLVSFLGAASMACLGRTFFIHTLFEGLESRKVDRYVVDA